MRVTISNNLMSNFKLQEEMKNLSFILGLALGMLTVGCSNDPIVENNTPELGNTVTLGVSLDEQTRTSLGNFVGDKYQVLWSAGDKIAVNGTKSDAVAEQYVGKSSAKFTVANVTAPYSIVYPAEAIDNNGQLNLPTFQAYASGSFASGTAVMAGYATDNNVAMKHLLSVIKLTIAKGSETKSAFNAITITALDGSAISGVFSVDYQGAEIAPVAGKDIVTITNVPIVDDKAVVYVAVPAGDYTKGLGVKVVGSDFSVMSRTAYTSKGIELGSGYLVNMPELTFAGKDTEDIVITTAAELVQFATAYNSGFDGVALLGNDIDMTGVKNLPYFSLNEGALFDGQGYAIKNWTSNHGLINTNYGTVKNLTIDQSCNLTFDMSNTNASTPHGLVVNSNVGLVSGCINNADVTVTAGDVVKDRSVGAIVGIIGTDRYNAGETTDKYINARVENCINNGDISITVDSYASGWFFAGGVAGCYYPHAAESNGGVYNCVNNGNLKVAANNDFFVVSIGGVIGTAGKIYTCPASNNIINYCKIEDCVNNGDLFYAPTRTTSNAFLGGIVGVSHASITNATNNGNITLAENTSLGGGSILAAGITAAFSGHLKNLKNTGTITLSNIVANNRPFYVAGVAGVKLIKHQRPALNLTANGCTNSGNITVDFTTTSTTTNVVGGVFADCDYTPAFATKNKDDNNTRKTSLIDVKNCENSGNITVYNTGGASARVGGIVGSCDEGSTPMDYCVNSGDISVTGDIKATSPIAGLAGIGGSSFTNCQSLGDITVEGESAGSDYMIKNTNVVSVSAICARRAGNTGEYTKCVIDSKITYRATTPENGIVFGLIQGDRYGNKVTTVSGITVKSTTTINGVKVTADNLADHTFLVGRDQEVWDNRADSHFQIAEGGVVLE